MAMETFVAGAYGGTYNAVGVGITGGGFEYEQTMKQEVIDESDVHGGTTMDYIYRGGDAYLSFECLGYKAGSTTPFWPWGGGSIHVGSTTAAPIGRLASATAQAFVLTATANTPAAAAPATHTGPNAILAPNFNGKLLFHSKLRKVPIRLQYLPYVSGGGFYWAAIT